MTIKKTLQKFEELKKAVLADGKVDENEVEVLLDFIAPYARAGNRNFTNLFKRLVKARMDGKVTEEESELLIQDINEVSIFLEREKKIEQALSGLFLLGFVAVVAWTLVRMLS